MIVVVFNISLSYFHKFVIIEVVIIAILNIFLLYFQELVGSTRPRVWRNLLLATVGVMLVVAIAIATVIVTRK